MRKPGVRQYIAGITVIPLIIITVCLESIFLINYFSELDLHIVERGKLIARQVGSSSEYGVLSNNISYLSDIAKNVAEEPGVLGVSIQNSSKKVLAEYGDISFANTSRHMEGNIVIVDREASGYLLIFQPIYPETVKLNELETGVVAKALGKIILKIDLEQTEKLKAEMLVYTVTASLLILILTSYIVYLVSRRISKPIGILSKTIQKITHGNLNARVDEIFNMEEFDVLSQGMNQMTEQLQQDHDSLQKRVDDATLSIRKSKEKAELANKAKTKFLAAASHDLRQPIHALNLFLEVLSLTELNDRQRELLDKASAASNASSELLTTLLDFSRIEAGVVQPRMQTFFLQPLFNNIENELAPQADVKNITYRTRETLVAVQSDPKLVELILRNLVTNAIRYTEHGGLLVACRRHGGQAIVEVWDTGIGIAREQQEEVFLEFRQLGNPERDRQKGLGLGLAIALRLANTMGQRLSLSSTPNRGSVFRFTLPIAEIAAQRPLTEISQSILMPLNVRILLIDDDKSVLEGMCHLLHEWGCECDAAETIEAALAKANAHTPDIIISDYRLREQRTGVDAIAAIRALIGKTVPALLITGDTAPDRLREAKSSGIPLLHKPLSPNQLYRELVEVQQVVSRFTDL